jgi:hypothetical protein
MNPWQATFFGLKHIPRELTAFEIEAFFTFTVAERQVIEQRRRPALKLGLALQIGFLRMSGRVLDAVRIVPAVLWRHLPAFLKYIIAPLCVTSRLKCPVLLQVEMSALGELASYLFSLLMTKFDVFDRTV